MYEHIKDLLGLLEARTTDGRVAHEISDAHFAKLIALRRRFGLSQFESELLLADIVRAHEAALFAALRNCIHHDDAIDAVSRIFGGSE